MYIRYAKDSDLGYDSSMICCYDYTIVDDDFKHKISVEIPSFSLAIIKTYLELGFDNRYAAKMICVELLKNHNSRAVSTSDLVVSRTYQNTNLPKYFKDWQEISGYIDDELEKMLLLR